MKILETYQSILETGKASTEKALQLFDDCEPVNINFMLGRWRGFGFHTNHPMDGLLEASSWYGKEFIDPENVHPLLFLDARGNLLKVVPNYTMINFSLKFPIFKSSRLRPLQAIINSLLNTEKSQARLRMMEYRGKISATMIYDYLPINDSFRKIKDNNTVLGVMDFKQLPQPFFFVLRRCTSI